MEMYNPSHPGQILKEYLGDISITEASERLGVTRAMLSRIVNGKSRITPEMAMRLSQSLGTTVAIWLNLQSQYDAWQIKNNPPQGVKPMFDVMAKTPTKEEAWQEN